MGVTILQPYPVKETGAQTLEMLVKRVITLGGVQTGQFLVDCDTYAPTMHLGPGQQGTRTLNILHNSEYPASTFALLEVPQGPGLVNPAVPQSATPGMKIVSLVADNVFDLLVNKMAPIYTSKKIKIESKGKRFELGDFVVKLGSVTMSQNFKGILVEVEYRPCVVAEACWDLLMEFMQGILGQHAQTNIPRTLQPRIKEVYTPLDTMHQYMDQFTTFRKVHIAIHKEKVSRREIGVLTSAKTPTRQYKILAPVTPEKPVKYVRKPIDYTVLDDLGCGANRNKQMGGVRNSKNSMPLPNIPLMNMAPNAKPPTPPMANKMGTLRSNTIYRTPPAVAPPQVPSHYAPNYPVGHPRRQTSQIEQRGYTTLPLQTSHPQQQATQNQVPLTATGMPFPQRNDRHIPMSHQQIIYAENKGLGIPTGPASPPLPPPPPIEPVVDESQSLIPKNYIEKVIAVYDYSAEREDELSFQENSVIYVLKKNDDGWFEGVNTQGVTGLCPGNYVEPCL